MGEALVVWGISAVVLAAPITICFLKGRTVFGALGCVGVLLWPFGAAALVGAVQLARPDSRWAIRYYSPEKRSRATAREARPPTPGRRARLLTDRIHDELWWRVRHTGETFVAVASSGNILANPWWLVIVLAVLMPGLLVAWLVIFGLGRKYLVAVTDRRLLLGRCSGLGSVRELDTFDLGTVRVTESKRTLFSHVLVIRLPDDRSVRLRMDRMIWRAGEPQAIHDAIIAAGTPTALTP